MAKTKKETTVVEEAPTKTTLIIKSLSKESAWYGDRDKIVGQEFELIEGTSHYIPVSKKAKEFAKEQDVQHFTFISSVTSEPKKK